MKRFAIACVLTGCTVAETSSSGPQIHITISSTFGTASDSDSVPSLDLDTAGSSNIDVQIDASDGMTTGKTDTTSPAASVSVMIAVPGTAIPDSPYTANPSFGFTTFTRATPIVLPPSAAPGTMTVHVVAVDGLGLHSNVIDLSVALRAF